MTFSGKILILITVISPLLAMAQPVDDVVSTQEDVPVTFSLTANDTSPEGIDPATVDLDTSSDGLQQSRTTQDGSYAVDAAGNLSFTPLENFNGTATLSYSVNDVLGNNAGEADISITVDPVNDPPIAVDDEAETAQNDPVIINVLANDSDVDGTLDAGTIDLNQLFPGVQATLITLQGTFTSDGSGNVTFTPLLNLTGSASATYTVEDSDGTTSETATISVVITGVNEPPVSNNDSGSTTEDSSGITVSILDNDSDDSALDPASVDLDPSVNGRQSMITNEMGTFSVNASGVLSYTPAADYNGTATVQYTVNDDEGVASNPSTVTISVTSVNDLPVANNDAATTDENTAVVINVTSNDTDIDGNINIATVDLDPATGGMQTTITRTGGSFVADASGNVTFTPTAGYNGSSSATYVVQDNESGVSNVATISVTVNGVNDPPVASDDVASTNEDTDVDIPVLGNDTDDGGLNASTIDLNPAVAGIQSTRSLTEGVFSVVSGVVNFEPDANYFGPVSIEYTVNDNTGLTSNAASITVTVNSVNDAPTAAADAATTPEGTAVTISVLNNDSDIDGALNATTVDLNITLTGVQGSASNEYGSWVADAVGVVTFTPDDGVSGPATISYTVSDNEGAISNAAVITVNVSDVNDPPAAVDDVATTDEDTPVTINILSNDSDDNALNAASVDLDPLAPGRQSSLTNLDGTFTISNAGVLTFNPALNIHRQVSISYTVNDNDGATSNVATVTITVESVNDAPAAVNDAATTAEDTPVSINILSNDTDVDGTIDASQVDLDLSAVGVQNTRTTTNGTFIVSSSGVVTFTPNTNYFGPASTQYTVRDNEGAVSNAATITVTITPVNDPPSAVADAVSTNEGVAVTINILSNDTDDGGIDAASVDLDPTQPGTQTSVSVTGGTFVVSASGVVTFSPSSTYNGTVEISYTVRDNLGVTSNAAMITVTVNPVNTAPVAQGDAVTTVEDTPVTIEILANDSDDAGLNPATVDLNINVAGIQTTRVIPQGTFTVDASGVVTFVPTANYFGTASINYTVRDHEGGISDPATIIVTVTGVNDKPVAVNDTRTTNEDTATTVNVISNDSDVDGTVVQSSVDLNPNSPGIQSTVTTTEGTFSVSTLGIVTFVPVNNFFGTAVISYTVMDDNSAVSDPATITITVTPVNDPPVANNDIASTNQGEAISLNVTSNDIDVDGTLDVASVDLDPSTPGRQTTRTTPSGTYTVTNDGTVTLTPLSTFSGNASITYTVADNLGAVSTPATISILVSFVNQKPVANPDVATTTEDTPVSFSVVSNDTDDGSINSATVDLNTTLSGIQSSLTLTEGTFTVNTSGVVTYTPALNFEGTLSINYTVNDNIGETSNVATITVTVTGANDPPLAVNDAVTTSEDVAVTINVLSNDSDEDGSLDVTTVDLVPATDVIDRTSVLVQGTFAVSEVTGVVTFTPAANFTGTVTRTYNVRDNSGMKSNTATINVTVENVNDPPSFNVIAEQRVLRNSATKTITISGISPGPGESEQLLFTATSQNTTLLPHPTITYSGTGATASLAFKPQLNQSGTAEVTVRVVDSGLNEFTRSFVVTVVDVAIVSTPVTVAVPGEIYQYNITTTDIPETLSLHATQKPAWLTLTSTGKNTALLSGTPPVSAIATTVTIQLRDGASVVDEQQFNLEINKRPVASPVAVETNEDIDVNLGPDKFGEGYTDPDGHPLSDVEITKLPRHGDLFLGSVAVDVGQIINVSVLDQLIYRPDTEYSGLDTLYFKVSDSYTFSMNESYVHFVILPVNDPPQITFVEPTPLVFDIGRELEQIVSPAFEAEEPEDEMITGAVIGFRPPYFDPDHDVLSFNNTPQITGSFDPVTGLLTLAGTASVADYVNAIRTVTYNYIELDDIVLDPRTVYFTLTDGTSVSTPKDRTIALTFEFVELDIPEVFTPDGNGRNDYWDITSTAGLSQYNDAVIRVFDKRGMLVHETVGFDNRWDGRSKGRDLPEGSYLYTIDLKYGNIKYTGSVMVLREIK